jgi:hypothetical protein
VRSTVRRGEESPPPLTGIWVRIGDVRTARPDRLAGLGVGTAIGAVGFGLACLWEGIRSFRIEAQVSGQKLTIRNELRTYTVGSGDIRAITLQPHTNGQHRTRHWIARAGLTGGKSIWIDSLDCGPARWPPEPDLEAAAEEFRALLGAAEGDIAPPESR